MTGEAQKRSDWTLIALLPLHLWLAHAVAFFAHEYAHAFVAWALGWKNSPFDLHFPPLSAVVVLIQLGINQNVDEAPIFAGGHGVDAGLIALAGMVAGNALVTLPLGWVAYGWAWRHLRRGWGMLAYWVMLASVGNLIDYVPIRTFTLESDMGSVRRGFGWSAWESMLILGIPTLVALGWFLKRVLPAASRWAFPGSAALRRGFAVLSAFLLFAFYGSAGLDDGGPVSHALSLWSIFAAFPLIALAAAFMVGRRTPSVAGQPSR